MTPQNRPSLRGCIALGVTLVLQAVLNGQLLGQESSPRPTTVFEELRRRRPDHVSDSAKHIYALLVADTTDPQLGQGPARDLARVRKLLEDSFSQSELTIRDLAEATVGPKAVNRAIDGLSVAPKDDVVFVFVSCHGYSDDQKQHVLKLPGGDVVRGDLVDRIWRKHPRLGVVLTDACAVRKDFVPRDLLNLENWSEGKRLVERIKAGGRLPTNRKLVRGLFAAHEGMVDISGCQAGQEAASDPTEGGFFTCAFAMACCHDSASMAPPPKYGAGPQHLRGKTEGRDFRMGNQPIDRNRDRFVDWEEFTTVLVENYLDIFYGSANQHVSIIRLNADELRRNEIPLPQGARIVTGTIDAKAVGPDGTTRTMGAGRIFVICNNRPAALKFIRMRFPRDPTVAYAENQAAARKILEEQLRTFLQKQRRVLVKDSIRIALTEGE